MGRLAGREAFNKDDEIMGDLAYCKRKEGSVKARKGLAFTLRAPKPKLDILVNFFSYPYLYLLVLSFFDLAPKNWHIVNIV